MTTPTRVNGVLRAALVPASAVLFGVAGAALLAGSGERWAQFTWMTGLLLTGAPVLWRTVREVAKGHFATDVVATLAIVAALWLREPLAGLIVVLMQTGGELLERYAEGRASQAVRELEDAAPRVAHRAHGGLTVDVPVDEVKVGDELLVRPGEMVPCDCVMVSGHSHLDVSRLTGEPLPRRAAPGMAILSGTLNIEGPLTVRTTAVSSESEYARIVELVRNAESSKAPLQRLADRYAVWFTPLTLLVCAAAWAQSGDPTRALAVLVIATPCPLILATPIAIIGGINRAARRQIIVRTGGALERLDSVRVAVFDKTGTLTVGRPAVSRVTPVSPHNERELLRLAGAVEQHSGHLLARSVVDAALALGESLPVPTNVVESAGRGVSAIVEGKRIAVGAARYVDEHLTTPRSPRTDRGLHALVSVDGALAGSIEYADRLRPGARELLAALRELGVTRVVLLSGDQASNVRAVAATLGIREAYGDLLPEEKVARVAGLSMQTHGVMMVGDGTNDAPALSRADVGIALGVHGGGVTTEAADVVILVDDLARVAEAIGISRRTMRIARQSIWVGLGLSGAGMVLAAFGVIPPVVGAVLQEAIDVAVIVNALRASAGPSAAHPPQANGDQRRGIGAGWQSIPA